MIPPVVNDDLALKTKRCVPAPALLTGGIITNPCNATVVPVLFNDNELGALTAAVVTIVPVPPTPNFFQQVGRIGAVAASKFCENVVTSKQLVRKENRFDQGLLSVRFVHLLLTQTL